MLFTSKIPTHHNKHLIIKSSRHHKHNQIRLKCNSHVTRLIQMHVVPFGVKLPPSQNLSLGTPSLFSIKATVAFAIKATVSLCNGCDSINVTSTQTQHT